MKRLLLLILLIPTLLMADAVIFSGNDVKALKQNLDLFGVVKVMSGALDPAVSGVAAPIGSAYLSTVHGLHIKTGFLNTDWTKNSLLPVDLTSDVMGILPVANGGTNSATPLTNDKVITSVGGQLVESATTTTQLGYLDATSSIQTQLDGKVEGPATATDNAIARYDGVTGKLVKDSLASLDNSGNLSSNTSTVTSANNGTIDLGNQTAANSSSGVLTGGVLSINADPTKIDITAGSGTFTDIWTDPANPKLYSVSWAAKNAVPVTYLATNPSSFIGIDSAGNVVQYPTSPTNSQRRDVILLGKLGHSGLTTVQNVVPQYMVAGSAMSQLRDLITEFKLINTGNIISANGANLNINKSAGSLLGLGLNYANDDKDPNKIEIASQTAATFQYRTQTGVATSNTTAIIPGSYDNGGVVTAITGSGSRATNQRIYLFPNGNIRIQYGQHVYSNLAAAIAGASGEAFVTFGNIAEDAALIGILSVTKGATALNNSSNAAFLAVSKLGEFAVGAAGFSTTNLQQAYSNSTAPQIATDTTLGALDIKRGSAADTDNVLRVLNGAGASTAKITGEGRFNSAYLNADNMAKNGDVELTDITMFTCGASNTCARTTTSGEYSKGLAALKVTTAAAAVNVSQSVTTPSGVQKQGYVRLLYKIPATITDAQICSLVDGAEQTCRASNTLIANGLYNSVEIPLTFGTTSAGWKIKTTATYTQDIFVDNVILAQGLGTVQLAGNTVYSAKVNAAAVISGETGNWVTTCAWSPAGVLTCNFVTGFVSEAPNCWLSSQHSEASLNGFATTSSVSYATGSSSGVLSNSSVVVIACQKSGADYANASSSAYLSTNADTGFVPCTFSTLTWQGLGTVTNTSLMCKKDGDELVLRGQVNVGIVDGNTVNFLLPNNWGAITTSSTIGNSSLLGTYVRSASAGNVMFMANADAGVNFFRTSNTIISGTANPVTSVSGITAFGSGESLIFYDLRIPINEWSNSNTIIGSFAGYVQTPGSDSSVAFGAGSATICSTSTCTLSSRVGSSILAAGAVTRASTGLYTVLFSRTLKTPPSCTVSVSPLASANNKCTGGAITTTGFTIQCVNGTPALVDESFYFNCLGEL